MYEYNLMTKAWSCVPFKHAPNCSGVDDSAAQSSSSMLVDDDDSSSLCCQIPKPRAAHATVLRCVPRVIASTTTAPQSPCTVVYPTPTLSPSPVPSSPLQQQYHSSYASSSSPLPPNSTSASSPLPLINKSNNIKNIKNNNSNIATKYTTVPDERMVLFGGWNGRNYYNDLYEFNFTTNEWHYIRHAQLQPGAPSPRNTHVAVMRGNKSLVIFGGTNANQQRFNDLYEFTFDDQKWTRIEPNSGAVPLLQQLPQPRGAARGIMLEDQNRLLVFGGKPSSFLTYKLGDIYIFDFKQRIWIELDYIDNYITPYMRPEPLSSYAMVMSHAKGNEHTILIFGGSRNDDTFSNDMWSLTIESNEHVHFKAALLQLLPCYHSHQYGNNISSSQMMIVHDGHHNNTTFADIIVETQDHPIAAASPAAFTSSTIAEKPHAVVSPKLLLNSHNPSSDEVFVFGSNVNFVV